MPEWPYIAMKEIEGKEMEFTLTGIFADVWFQLEVSKFFKNLSYSW